jgi:hypothetical protein
MYNLFSPTIMRQRAEDVAVGKMPEDFKRQGIQVWIGSWPEIAGPDFFIHPDDERGVELFKEFAGKIAEHYGTFEKQPA